MNDENFKDQQTAMQAKRRLSWLPLQAGCLSLAIALVAIAIGLWIDFRYDSAPCWTLSVLIGSAPFTLILVISIIRRALGKTRDESKTKDEQG